MIVDFSDLKTHVKNIESFLDHKTLLNKNDQLFKVLEDENSGQVIGFEFNPTSENLAKWIFEQLYARMPDGVILEYVQLEETCTTSCLYSAGFAMIMPGYSNRGDITFFDEDNPPGEPLF